MMKFTKMHGCQNDFVFVNCFNKNISVNLNKLAKNMILCANGIKLARNVFHRVMYSKITSIFIAIYLGHFRVRHKYFFGL